MFEGLILGVFVGLFIRFNPLCLADILTGLLPSSVAFETHELYVLNFILCFALMGGVALILGLHISALSAIIGIGGGFFAQRVYREFFAESSGKE